MTMERKNSNVVVHVRSDSGKDLDALFHVIQSASAAVEQQQPSSNSLPMKLRKLPPSFFKQPTILDPSKLAPDDNSGLIISHSRAHSSPASLTVPSSSAGPPNYSLHPVHNRTQSYDSQSAFEENPHLPPGWEMRTSPTGQPYFMNHFEQITTWQDPRKSQSTSNLNSTNGLPDGWEQAITPEGEVYYINHITRTTSWVDPRLAMAQCRTTNQQQPPALRGGQQTTDHRQKAMLERLQLEKEKLKKRQQQLLEQEILLKHGLLEDGGSKSLLGNLAREAALAQMPTQPETTTSVHMRDESFDSGLGMSSTGGFGYNTDVELNNGGGSDTQMFDANYNSKEISSRSNEGRSGSGRLPDFFDSIPGTNVDFGTIEGSDNTPTSMETDDLGVGLDINTDILNDVESVLTPNMSKIPDPNFLTWL